MTAESFKENLREINALFSPGRVNKIQGLEETLGVYEEECANEWLGSMLSRIKEATIRE